MKHVINYSGGLCSFWAAHRVIQKYGTADVTLLFADTLIESPDLYEFSAKAEVVLGVKVTTLSYGLTPWQLFRKEGLIANDRFPICSVRLKRQVLDKWYEANCDPSDTICYVGFDFTEFHRLDAIRAAKPDWKWESPMCDEPLWDKCRMRSEAEKLGLPIPELYTLGFPHNNCGGRCVKAGITHWVHLYKTLPERYLEWEQEEQWTIEEFELRDIKWMTFLKDRRNKVTNPLSLKQLRERIEAGEKFRDHDWGGCGCSADFDQIP